MTLKTGLGVVHRPRRNIDIPFGVEKLEWWGHLRCKNFEHMYNRLYTIPACDGRTDDQTSCHGIVRAMNTLRAVKTTVGKSVPSLSQPSLPPFSSLLPLSLVPPFPSFPFP